MWMNGEKVLFDVLLPATGRHYDFWVPRDVPMQTISEMVAHAMQIAEPDFYRASPDAALVLLSTGEMQNPNATPAEAGFSNSSQFVLM